MNKICSRCHTPKDVNAFYKREDRPGYYAWCIACCKVQGRSPNYPPVKDRGCGSLRPQIPEN